MKSRDWFGLGVRFAGVWCGLQSSVQLMGFLDIKLKLGSSRVPSPYGEQVINPESYLPYVVGYLALAVLLVTRTEFFVRMSYPESHSGEATEVDSNRAQVQSSNAS